MHLELVNQSDCNNTLNSDGQEEFDMICAGDIKNGGRDVCQVCNQYVSLNQKKIGVNYVAFIEEQILILVKDIFSKFLY